MGAERSTAARWRDVRGTRGEVFVVAHRGAFVRDAHAVAPENALPAIARARALGCDMVEVDVRFTADGTAVVLHDATVDRTTTGRGAVAEMRWADVAALALINPETGAATGARVPTLEEVFLALGDDMMINVECKTGPEAIAAVAAVAADAGVSAQVTVKTQARGPAAWTAVADILAATAQPVEYIPILVDDLDGVEVLEQVCDLLAPTCVECIVRLPAGPASYPAFAHLGHTMDGGPLFSMAARQIVEDRGVRQFVNTLYADPAIPGTQWNGGRSCQLGRIAPDSVYGFWIAHGATVLQTDEPEYVLDYLRQAGFRRT